MQSEQRGGTGVVVRLADVPAVQTLRAERDRAEAALEATDALVVVLDREGRVERANAALRALLGLSEEELDGRDWFDVAVAEADRAAARVRFEQVAAGEESPSTVETEIRGRRGNRLLSWHQAPLRDGHGHVTGVVATAEDVTDRRRAEQRARRAGYYDDLTGLPNRALLREHLSLALARASRHRRGVALLYLDIDDFKLVNDSLGHRGGDLLLCRIAGRLRSMTRQTDLLARQGGDEFLLLLADIEGDATEVAETVASQINDAVQEPFSIDGAEFQVGACIGISVLGEDADDEESLLAHADAAMYQAQGSGETGYCRYQPVDGPSPLERLSLTTRLRRALRCHEFLLHYQPIVSLPKGRIAGVEALLRWRDPDRGLVPPGTFIPVAEETGQIEQIGEWVVKELCLQARRWESSGLRPFLTFNASPRQLRSSDLSEIVAECIDEAGLEPGRFTVEITESATLRERGSTAPILHELAATGVRLAIDDFGAGYSSLSRLREMPVHALKIDRSFLREVPGSREAGEIVAAIIQLASALGMTTVAEGVETPAQLEFLIAHGCPLAQGFHLGRPMPAEEIADRLRAERPRVRLSRTA